MYKAFELGISSQRKSRNVEKGRSIVEMLRLFVFCINSESKAYASIGDNG